MKRILNIYTLIICAMGFALGLSQNAQALQCYASCAYELAGGGEIQSTIQLKNTHGNNSCDQSFTGKTCKVCFFVGNEEFCKRGKWKAMETTTMKEKKSRNTASAKSASEEYEDYLWK